MFDTVWTPSAVSDELRAGRQRGYDVPVPTNYTWLKIVDPISMPSEWLALDLGRGEIAAMSLALENSEFVVMLDDSLARRTAQAAGLEVWGTLKVLLEAKSQGIIAQVSPYVTQLTQAGMWISADVRQRILRLASEA
ncbi:MAG: DUF3368 domain-containing protein [Caldilineaceae bacterium]|nr:DUF3368 domain-containing protein [Caldilineaceae bacterium]MCB0137400.1 DUF3368 domain-containing protein [Caldilineaceae bacterium]